MAVTQAAYWHYETVDYMEFFIYVRALIQVPTLVRAKNAPTCGLKIRMLGETNLFYWLISLSKINRYKSVSSTNPSLAKSMV